MYDAPGDYLEGLFAGTGAEMPNAIGLAGGMPGAAIRVARVVDTDLRAHLAERARAAGKSRRDRRRREILVLQACAHADGAAATSGTTAGRRAAATATHCCARRRTRGLRPPARPISARRRGRYLSALWSIRRAASSSTRPNTGAETRNFA